jgi:hypothetical protein
MLYFIVPREKEKKARIRYEIFRENACFQDLLTELEHEQLRWFGHVKRMDRTRILRKELELKFKGIRPV